MREEKEEQEERSSSRDSCAGDLEMLFSDFVNFFFIALPDAHLILCVLFEFHSFVMRVEYLFLKSDYFLVLFTG